MMSNQLAIALNNHAVDELKLGNLLNAYEQLSMASFTISDSHKGRPHVSVDASIYRFSWMTCPNSVFLDQLSNRANEGCLALLCLKFLRINVPQEYNAIVDQHCPCGFGWVIWYNLGILSTLLGTILGAQASGRYLLQQGKSLLETVRQRAEPEPPSRHWATLQLSVLVNQACSDLEANASSCKSHLQKTHQRLEDFSKFLHFEEWMEFYLSLKTLSHETAEAA